MAVYLVSVINNQEVIIADSYEHANNQLGMLFPTQTGNIILLSESNADFASACFEEEMNLLNQHWDDD